MIVDAGANIGLTSIYFANKYPNAKIIALEPELGNFELLKKNAAPYSQIAALQAAVWNKNEEIDLIDPGLGFWGFMTEKRHPSEKLSGSIRHPVMGMTIDKLLENHSLTKIDILKMDIEGAEKEVFSDTSSWIGKIDSIIIELHDHIKPGCSHSFYSGVTGFNNEWSLGGHVFLSRGNRIRRRST